jgi:glycosyltransferase involved in cell wall biosynthesis
MNPLNKTLYDVERRQRSVDARVHPIAERPTVQDFGTDYGDRQTPDLTAPPAASDIAVALLTGGGDKPYVFGLTTALTAHGTAIDLIGSDDLNGLNFHNCPNVTFLNLRGDQRTDSSFARKVHRVTLYYTKLLQYAWKARPGLFHILWNNKVEFFDRTLLMLYYKWLGKKIVLTAHNVNKGRRDRNDTAFNRFTLWVQYHLTDHVFVHTQRMKQELVEQLRVSENRITVIPFGINNAVPHTDLTSRHARQRLGIADSDRTILFFGRITPYKGLDYLVEAFRRMSTQSSHYRLIVAGRPDNNCGEYWNTIQNALRPGIESGRVLLHAHHIPDNDTEIYFKAADVFILPYRDIYQSGVLFLGQSFGLPVVAADVGSFRSEVVEGKTGFVFNREDPADLAKTIQRYFDSDLYKHLNERRSDIREYTEKHHSWSDVAQLTTPVYARLLRRPAPYSSTPAG